MSSFSYVQMGVGPEVDPGHARHAEIMSLSWLGNTFGVSPEEDLTSWKWILRGLQKTTKLSGFQYIVGQGAL